MMFDHRHNDIETRQSGAEECSGSKKDDGDIEVRSSVRLMKYGRAQPRIFPVRTELSKSSDMLSS